MLSEEFANILIVEDDKTSAKMLSQMVEKCGHTVIAVIENGEEAISIAGEKKPDLVLMDITLAGKLDGICTADSIFKEFNIPFIYITSGTDDETFQRAKKSMPLGYILKPFNLDIIRSNIEMALYKFNMGRKLHESEMRNKEILSHIPDIMFYLNDDGSFIDDVDKVMARKIWPENIAKKAVPYIQKTLKSAFMHDFEYELKREHGIEYYEARIVDASKQTVLVVVRNISKRKEAERELLAYKENLEKIVDERSKELAKANEKYVLFGHVIEQSPNSSVIVNSKGIVEYINEKCKNISGYTENELIGVDVTKPGNPVIAEPEVWAKMTSSDQWNGEIYNVSKNGSLYYGDATVSAIRDSQNNLTHYIMVCEDITEKKQEQLAIDQARETIEKSNLVTTDLEMDWQEWKEKMMSRNVSRTDRSLFRNINNSFTQGAGFGSLISLLEMLAQGAREKNDAFEVDGGLFKLILDNVRIAQDAFKTFSNIDWIISNEFDLENISLFQLHSIIRAIIEKADEMAKIKKQKIVVNDFDNSYRNIHVSINRDYFFAALYEGIINALKFSKSKTYIVVMLSVMNKKVQISITSEPEQLDKNIIGVPDEYTKVIFEPFYRLAKTVYEQYKTLDFGLGLTLIEKIINKHGGEVHIGNISDHSDLKREPQVKVNLNVILPLITKK